MSTTQYGKYFWVVSTPEKHTSGPDKGKFVCRYFNADRMEVKDGCLLFFNDKQGLTSFVFAPGTWRQAWAASCLDGRPVAEDILEAAHV